MVRFYILLLTTKLSSFYFYEGCKVRIYLCPFVRNVIYRFLIRQRSSFFNFFEHINQRVYYLNTWNFFIKKHIWTFCFKLQGKFFVIYFLNKVQINDIRIYYTQKLKPKHKKIHLPSLKIKYTTFIIYFLYKNQIYQHIKLLC